MKKILNPQAKSGYLGVYSKNKSDTNWVIKDPKKERTFFVTNLSAFVDSVNKRRKDKLDKSHLSKVGRGERKHHKGWTVTALSN